MFAGPPIPQKGKIGPYLDVRHALDIRGGLSELTLQLTEKRRILLWHQGMLRAAQPCTVAVTSAFGTLAFGHARPELCLSDSKLLVNDHGSDMWVEVFDASCAVRYAKDYVAAVGVRNTLRSAGVQVGTIDASSPSWPP
jgi:hypothetical protein